MQFTNDDLKRLKHWQSERFPLQGSELTEMVNLTKALIARLEAAEENVNAAWEIEDILEVPTMLGDTSRVILQKAIDRFRDSHETWRKVAGK